MLCIHHGILMESELQSPLSSLFEPVSTVHVGGLHCSSWCFIILLSGVRPPTYTALMTQSYIYFFKGFPAFWVILNHFLFQLWSSSSNEWFSPSIFSSVTAFLLCSHHHIIMKFSGVITIDRSGVMQKVKVKGQGHRGHIHYFVLFGIFLDCNSNFTDGYKMMHKAWSSKEEVPFCFSRSSVIFRGHTG